MVLFGHTTRTLSLALLLASTSLISGCSTTQADKTGGSDYTAGEARTVGHVMYGTITHLRSVTIRENPRDAQRRAEQLGSAGSTIGAIAGMKSDSTAGIIIGSLVGAFAGTALAEDSQEFPAWELDIEMHGETLVIVQAKNEKDHFTVGMPVRVVQMGSLYRVTPRGE
jgi:outer membrane lipoprotein SlyB